MRRPPALVPEDPLDLVPAGAVVAVAMSGGVDSSVAAARCVERGLEVIGITLAMWPRPGSGDADRGCCGIDAVADARRVAADLGIRHYAWNLEEQFHDAVIADFEAEYLAGRTPNPCVRCNDRIKFGALLERALAVGASHVATGHYARIGRRGGRYTLHRGADPAKDQAYTLFQLGQARLARAVFPVGGFGSKGEVRGEAARLGLGTAAKPDSQELCFVAGSVTADLEWRLAGGYRRGPIVDTTGEVVGEHRGLPFYTVGQRGRLGLRPRRPDAPPAYVVELRVASNTLVVGSAADCRSARLRARDCAWIDAAPPAGSRCAVQVRAHGEPRPVTVVGAGDELALDLDDAAPAAAPGQAAVLFEGDEVLGGGLITAEAA